MKMLKTTLLAGIAAASCMTVSTPANAQAGDFWIGQVSPVAGGYCPRNWAEANGQLLPISSNQALFSILGTTYGGDGRTTFALPDLRGRTPIGQGTGSGLPTYRIGQRGGTTSFTLNTTQLPVHNHAATLGASPTNGDTTIPVRNSFARSVGVQVYLDGAPAINNMHSDTLRINNTGGNVPVNKVSPYLAIRWCVLLFGVFPSRN